MSVFQMVTVYLILFQLMHEMPVIPQSGPGPQQPVYSSAGPMQQQYGQYMPPQVPTIPHLNMYLKEILATPV